MEQNLVRSYKNSKHLVRSDKILIRFFSWGERERERERTRERERERERERILNYISEQDSLV